MQASQSNAHVIVSYPFSIQTQWKLRLKLCRMANERKSDERQTVDEDLGQPPPHLGRGGGTPIHCVIDRDAKTGNRSVVDGVAFVEHSAVTADQPEAGAIRRGHNGDDGPRQTSAGDEEIRAAAVPKW